MHKPPFTGGSVDRAQRRPVEPVAHQPEPDLLDGAAPVHGPEPGRATVFRSQISGLRGISADYGLGSSTQWNLAVEREIFRGVRLEASYQGNSSTSTPTGVPSNLPVWADGATDSGSSYQSRRPDQFLGDNGGIVTNDGRTRFDQFLLLARARRSGLFAQLSWAYTHARRNFAGGGREPRRHPRLGQLDQRAVGPQPDAGLPEPADDRRLLHLGPSVPARQHDGPRQDPRRLDGHRERLLELRQTRARPSASTTTRTPTTGATTSPRSSATSRTRRPRSPARATCSTSGSTRRPSCTRTARSTARSARRRRPTA